MIDGRTLRRLALAAVASATLHAAVIAVGRIELPRFPEELPPLAVRIVSAPPAARPIPEKAVEHPRHARATHPSAPRVATIAVPAALALPADPQPQDLPIVDEAPPQEPPAPVISDEPVIVATAPASTYVPDSAPVRSLPRKGRITYNLVYRQLPVGRTVQTWETDGTRYQLASRSETTGIVDFFRSQHRTYMSRGALTRHGLQPEIFLMSRNRGRGAEEASARFDWQSGSVTLEGSTAPRNEPLPPHTQDLLSLMYQLSLDPPVQGRFQQSVTNGNRVEIYELDALPEETIETPLGALRAIPVRQVRKPGEESLELWFATEYRYLPVRIRFFDRQGESQGEQIVTEIRLSEQ